MKKKTKNLVLLRVLLLLLIPMIFAFATLKPETKIYHTTITKAVKSATDFVSSKMMIYDSLQLNNLGLSKRAFEEGIKGYNVLRSQGKLNNENIDESAYNPCSLKEFTLYLTKASVSMLSNAILSISGISFRMASFKSAEVAG